MDPEVHSLGLQLADTVVRNTATAVSDKITASKAKKKDRETIAVLEEIVNALIADKSELVRIAQAYEQELVSQRLADSDIAYITTNVVPVVTKLMESSSGSAAETQEMLELFKPLLAAETVTVLQLL